MRPRSRALVSLFLVAAIAACGDDRLEGGAGWQTEEGWPVGEQGWDASGGPDGGVVPTDPRDMDAGGGRDMAPIEPVDAGKRPIDMAVDGGERPIDMAPAP